MKKNYHKERHSQGKKEINENGRKRGDAFKMTRQDKLIGPDTILGQMLSQTWRVRYELRVDRGETGDT